MIATAPSLDNLRATLPHIAGEEAAITAITQHSEPVFLPKTNLRLENITAGFACALHMHQPTIPAGANGAPGRWRQPQRQRLCLVL
jgi:hypothetical protein